MQECNVLCKDRGGVKKCQYFRYSRQTVRGGTSVPEMVGGRKPQCTCNCDPEGNPEPETAPVSNPWPKIDLNILKNYGPFIGVLPLPWILGNDD